MAKYHISHIIRVLVVENLKVSEKGLENVCFHVLSLTIVCLK